jgi:hypothetical protein
MRSPPRLKTYMLSGLTAAYLHSPKVGGRSFMQHCVPGLGGWDGLHLRKVMRQSSTLHPRSPPELLRGHRTF